MTPRNLFAGVAVTVVCGCILIFGKREPDGVIQSRAAASRPDAQRRSDVPERMAEELWKIQGAWASVAADPRTGDVFAITYERELHRFDRHGQRISVAPIEFDLRMAGGLRLANLTGDAVPEVVAYASWGRIARAYDANGSRLWDCAVPTGINDVWVVDLDNGPGVMYDEVLVACNGDGGLRALNTDGQLRWRHPLSGNVWSVSAYFSAADPSPTVLAVSGAPRAVTASGQSRGALRLRRNVKYIRVAGDSDLLITVSQLNKDKVLAATTFGGTERWSVTIEPSDAVQATECYVSPDGARVALAFADGRLRVFDAHDGTWLASLSRGEIEPGVAWLPAHGDTPQVLVMATAMGLEAFTLPRRAATPDQPDVDRAR